MQLFQWNGVVRVLVPPFPHQLQVFLVQGFKADENTQAAAFFHQLQQAVIVGHIDAELADPFDAQWNQGFKKLFGPFPIPRTVMEYLPVLV